MPTGNECEFVHRETGIRIEPHWRLTRNSHLLTGNSLASATTVCVAGTAHIRTIADEALFSYLCAHGAAHAWSRIKWLADVGALLHGRSEAEIAALYHSAVERGA